MNYLFAWYVFIGTAITLSVLIEADIIPHHKHLWVVMSWPLLVYLKYRESQCSQN